MQQTEMRFGGLVSSSNSIEADEVEVGSGRRWPWAAGGSCSVLGHKPLLVVRGLAGRLRLDWAAAALLN